MRAGPIRQLLRPRRLGISQVRSAQHADKYLRFVDFACRRINNRDLLARVVHERLFSGDVVLAHHRAQPSLEPAKQIAEPAVAVALVVDLPIFLPKDHHRHAGPLQLARQGRPIRLDPPRWAGLDSRPPEQPQLRGVVGRFIRQRPRQSRRCRPFQIVLDRRPRHAQTSPDLARAHPAVVKSQQMSQLSHAQFPLRRHPHLLVDHRRAGSASVADSRGADAERLTGSGGRLHFGMVAGFKSERWPASNRNRWPDCVGIRMSYFAAADGFERPYGWAWLLMLASELELHQDAAARRWAGALAPLAEHLAARWLAFLPVATYPVRS